MEDFNGQKETAYKETKGGGEIDMRHTAGDRVGQAGHRDLERDSTRQNRLEWKC